MKTFTIDSIAFIGRTLDEYTRMLGFDPVELRGKKVLDCPAGACSFAAEAGRMGIDVVAADMLYGESPAVLKKKCAWELNKVVKSLLPVAGQYRWDFYGDVEGLVEKRRRAYGLFIEDYAEYRDRYVRATLPELPFEDGSFDMVLSAHLLFLYGDRLDYGFHVESVKELLRVASGEVRIFPVLGLDSLPSPHLGRVMGDLNAQGVKAELKEVPFEFQRGGNMMLRVLK